MKKVISFSLWGDSPYYCDGVMRNIEARDKHYPEWVCRFYHDETVPESVLYDAKNSIDVELVKMQKTTDVLGMYWRFHPMFDDDQIERFIVRDTDSTLGEREARAVGEWIATGKPFHIIRDCEVHNIPILGGTWGAIPGCIPLFDMKMWAWLSTVPPVRNNPRGMYHGTDQLFLSETVWPVIKNNHCAHVRAGVPGLKFTNNDIELPPWAEGDRYVGMVG